MVAPPCGLEAVWMLGVRVPLWLCRGAQTGPEQGLRMSEPAGRVCADPGPVEHRRLPRQRRGHRHQGRLFFGDFLLAKQKKVTRTPGDSRLPPSTPARFPNQHAKASTGSAQTAPRQRPGFDKLSPDGSRAPSQSTGTEGNTTITAPDNSRSPSDRSTRNRSSLRRAPSLRPGTSPSHPNHG